MSVAHLSGETRRLTTVPLIARWLNDQPGWSGLTRALDWIGDGRANYRSRLDEANAAMEQFERDLIDGLIAGRDPLPTLPEAVGHRVRMAADLEAAWSVAGRAHTSITWRLEAWPRENSDEILRFIRTTIKQSVTDGRAAAKKLGGINTPEDAARSEKFGAWLDIEKSHADYREAKTAHRYLMEMMATNDPEANQPLRTVWWLFKNVAHLYPGWKEDSLLKPTGQVMGTASSGRPWPDDILGLSHFLWICRHPEAEPWAPTTRDIRQVDPTHDARAADTESKAKQRRQPKAISRTIDAMHS